eukprot:m.34392 g.34392  ORF g.34392 m.34392 type:complete len:230 (+) comp12298_c0_seq1:242-931(+)
MGKAKGAKRNPSKTEGASKKSKAADKRSKPKAKAEYTPGRCLQWFKSYLTTDAAITPDGTMQLCDDLNVTPENVLLLVLAFKCQCQRMGTFTHEEWMQGMSELRVDSTEGLKAKFPVLEAVLQDPVEFKELFRYGYQFAKSALETPGQKSIDKQLAKDMLTVLLRSRWPLLPAFQTFLDNNPIKIINRDQWMSILEFSQVHVGDVEAYDENGAWPVLLDDFVEQQKMNT